MRKFLIFIAISTAFFQNALAQEVNWHQVERGLDYALVPSSKPAIVADGIITVVRIDPAHFDFQMISASEYGLQTKTGQDWCKSKGLVAAVNAGMFLQDGLTNVGYMKNFQHRNHAKFNQDNALIAFHPVSDSLPAFRIIDRECEDWERLVDNYQSVSQGIRMVDCRQKNRWSQQDRIWSMVVMAADKQGRALFIFCRSPYSVHDFIDILLALPLHIHNAMYLEGGPEATLYLKTDDCEIDRFGSYETGFYESDGNNRPWPIPNVIGIKRRK